MTAGPFVPDFEHVPYNRFLGVELGPCDEHGAELRLPPREDFRQEVGIVHGGVISGLLDTACVYAIRQTVEAGTETFTSIEFKLNFLRAARVDGGPLVARARILRRGRKVAVCTADVEQDGKDVATGLFTYMFLPAG